MKPWSSIRKLKSQVKKILHRHDYMMEFEDPKHPLDYTLRCKCGARASGMDDALKRMRL